MCRSRIKKNDLVQPWRKFEAVMLLKIPSSDNDSQITIENNTLKSEVVPYHEEHVSIGEFILQKLEDDPDLVGQIDLATGEKYTYRTMRERSVRCALWLQSQGLRPRDVVAFCTYDHLDYAMAFFAVQYIGAIVSPWDVTPNGDGIQHRINITKPKMAFANEELAAVFAKAAKKAEIDLKIIVFGRVPGFSEFESVIAEPGIEMVEKFGCTQIESSSETALIVFSSGTTGLPKGVALSHKGLTMLSHQAEEIGMPGNVCLSFGTTGWLSSTECILMSLLLNMPRLILPPFDEHLVCATIEKYKVSWVYILPSMINQLLKSEAIRKYDLSSLAHVVYGGELLSVESYRAFEQIVPGVQILSGYGMTEACGFISIQSRKSPPGSCGKIMKNVQLRVIDPDTGRTLGANQKGELLLKYACMMNGYYGNPKATSETIDEGGWLHSGDLGYYDESGEIFVVDRLKDIIRLGEFDTSPTEIEGVIWSHPGVKEVAVVGQPRPQERDELLAFVVRAEDSSDTGEQVTEREIIDLVAAELPEISWLRGGVKFIDQIPKTASNKIQRKVLRDWARSMV